MFCYNYYYVIGRLQLCLIFIRFLLYKLSGKNFFKLLYEHMYVSETPFKFSKLCKKSIII